MRPPKFSCAAGRLPAGRMKVYYESMEELEQNWSLSAGAGNKSEDGKPVGNHGMSFRCSLNGTWKFSCAEHPGLRQADFYQEDYDLSKFDEIQVPGHIQLQGYDKCQYINTMYLWDGHDELRPPHISKTYNPVGSYVKEFTVPEKWEGKRTFISFRGIETACYVWCNGQFVGYSELFSITDC